MRGRHIIQRLLCLRTVTAEIIHDERSDTYFLRGNSFPIKDKLKSLGFRWDGIKKMWYTKKPDVAEKGEKLLETAGPPTDREPTEKQIAFAWDLIGTIGKHWDDFYKGAWKKPPTKQELKEMGFHGISKFIDELVRISKEFPSPKDIKQVLDLFNEVGESALGNPILRGIWHKLPTEDELKEIPKDHLNTVISILKSLAQQKHVKEHGISVKNKDQPPTAAQLDYVKKLMRKIDWLATDHSDARSDPPSMGELKQWTRQQVSDLIEDLKSAA